MKKLLKGLAVTAILVALFVLGYSILNILEIRDDMVALKEKQDEVALIETDSTWDYMEEYDRLKAENSDFVGWVKFDSGLINLPFMYNKTDDYYLRRDFHKNYDGSGIPFMESAQTLDSRNITIYGHYVYFDETSMFTPLDQLRFPENYEANKIFRLYLENEIRTYEVAAVVEFDTKKEWKYAEGTYDEDEWRKFVSYAVGFRNYDTGVKMRLSDNYVTLQTCIRNRTDDRTVIIGKEIERKKK